MGVQPMKQAAAPPGPLLGPAALPSFGASTPLPRAPFSHTESRVRPGLVRMPLQWLPSGCRQVGWRSVTSSSVYMRNPTAEALYSHRSVRCEQPQYRLAVLRMAMVAICALAWSALVAWWKWWPGGNKASGLQRVHTSETDTARTLRHCRISFGQQAYCCTAQSRGSEWYPQVPEVSKASFGDCKTPEVTEK